MTRPSDLSPPRVILIDRGLGNLGLVRLGATAREAYAARPSFSPDLDQAAQDAARSMRHEWESVTSWGHC